MANQYEIRQRPVVKDFAGNVMESPMEIFDNPVIKALSLLGGGGIKLKTQAAQDAARKVPGLFRGAKDAEVGKQLMNWIKKRQISKHNQAQIAKSMQRAIDMETKHGVAKKADDAINTLIRQNNLANIGKGLPKVTKSIEQVTPSFSNILKLGTLGGYGAVLGKGLKEGVFKDWGHSLAELLISDPEANIPEHSYDLTKPLRK